MRLRKTPVATAFRARGLATAMAVLGLLLALARGVSGLSWVSAASGTTENLQDVAPSGGACAPLPAGAVAWWPLNETAGTTAVADLVGGHTGTPLSGPVGSGGPSPTTGKVGGALYFTSKSTYVRVPNSPALNFGTGDFTIDAWINPVAVGPKPQPIVDKLQSFSNNRYQGYRLHVQNGQVGIFLADGQTAISTSVPVTHGMWQFVAVERAGTNINIYINGVLAHTVPLPAGFGSVSNTADLLVGGFRELGSPDPVDIQKIGLDEVELINRALSQQEIQALYNAGSAGKCKAKMINPNPTNPTN